MALGTGRPNSQDRQQRPPSRTQPPREAKKNFGSQSSQNGTAKTQQQNSKTSSSESSNQNKANGSASFGSNNKFSSNSQASSSNSSSCSQLTDTQKKIKDRQQTPYPNPTPKRVAITDENNPEAKQILVDKFTPPVWKEYLVLGDATLMSWLQQSLFSNIPKQNPKKVAGFSEIKTLEEYFTMVKKLAKPNSKVILGFGEDLVLTKKYEAKEFYLKLVGLLSSLITHNQVIEVIFCTIVPDFSRAANQAYMSTIKEINSKTVSYTHLTLPTIYSV